MATRFDVVPRFNMPGVMFSFLHFVMFQIYLPRLSHPKLPKDSISWLRLGPIRFSRKQQCCHSVSIILIDHKTGIRKIQYFCRNNLQSVKTATASGLVVRVPGYSSRGPGSIPNPNTYSDKYNTIQLRIYLEEKVAASV
jgi:hypothetical protein